MPVKDQEIEILKEAFKQFNVSSLELTEGYGQLQKDVLELKEKLHDSQLEEARLREEAERSHRLAAVGEMAAKMAHELKNPLGSIELFSSLLQKEITKLSDDPQKREWGRHLSSAVRTMDTTITNLLLFTRQPTPVLKKVDLNLLIGDLFAFIRHLLHQNDIEVEINTNGLVEPVCCDEDLIRQVLLNLVLNAIDAMPSGGQLGIKAYTEGVNAQQKTIIQCFDTGTGVSEQDCPKIFDPFFTTKKTGSGLGLAIAQNAISAHGGVIRVDQRTIQGSCFTISLPKLEEHDSCKTVLS